MFPLGERRSFNSQLVYLYMIDHGPRRKGVKEFTLVCLDVINPVCDTADIRPKTLSNAFKKCTQR